MSKLSIKSLVAVALILSLITSVMVYTYLKKASVSVTKGGYPVIVAKVDIPPKTKITADMLQEISMPPEYMQPGAIQEMPRVVGSMNREKIIAGEQITERRLLNAQNAGFVGLIPPDKRAITVSVTEVTGVAGFVKPGDYVDVVVTFDRQDTGEFASNFVLQNILVLAANHDTENNAGDQTVKDKKDAVKTATVTLAVSPTEEHWLALSDEKGKIRLALRPLFPDMVAVHTETATPVKLVGLQSGAGNSTRGRAAALSAPVVVPPAQSAPATPAPQEPIRVKEIPQYQPGITVIRGTKVDVVPY